MHGEDSSGSIPISRASDKAQMVSMHCIDGGVLTENDNWELKKLGRPQAQPLDQTKYS